MDVFLATKEGDLTDENSLTIRHTEDISKNIATNFSVFGINQVLPKVHYTGVSNYSLEFSVDLANDYLIDSEERIVEIAEKLENWSKNAVPLQFWAGKLYKGIDVFLEHDISFQGLYNFKNSPQQAKIKIKLIAYKPQSQKK